MLKLRGFKISLDDFGSGYSNISYLRRIPIDIIKLDRSLISRLQLDTASDIIVRNVISMLKDLDYVVLAEGVEDKSTFELLRQLGCDEVQGFYCAAPMKAAALEVAAPAESLRALTSTRRIAPVCSPCLRFCAIAFTTLCSDRPRKRRIN